MKSVKETSKSTMILLAMVRASESQNELCAGAASGSARPARFRRMCCPFALRHFEYNLSDIHRFSNTFCV